MEDERLNFTWEQQYQRSWDAIKEDDQGSLSSAIHQLQLRRRKPKGLALQSANGIIRRGIIRHIFLVIDGSRSCVEETDFHPTRLGCLLKALQSTFVPKFFAQNCLGQIGVVLIREGIGEKICELTSSCSQVLEALKRIPSLVLLAGASDNFPSIQNGLAVAVASLQLFSKACSFGEVLLCYSSVFSVDPGNLLLWAKERVVCSAPSAAGLLPVRVNVISFGGELHVLKEVSRITFGSFTVPLAEGHLREALSEYLAPPPDLFAKSVAKLAVVGFPSEQRGESVCCCHVKAIEAGFGCPRCMNVVCSVPGECAVCGLLLVRSAHISRSFASLWVVEEFRVVVDVAGEAGIADCFGCGVELLGAAEQVMQCTKCARCFCGHCDGLIHEQLQFCPGCE